MIKHIAAIVLAATSFAASAADVTTNFYLGADVGRTKVDGLNHDTSVGVFAGYDFNENFAAEVSYRDMGKFNLWGYGVNMKQTAVSVIGSAPIGSGVSVFGRLGYNRLSAEVGGHSNHDNGGLYGIGLGYAFNKNVSARVEYQRPASDTSNLGVAVSYKF